MSAVKIISGVISAAIIFVVLGVDYFVLGSNNSSTGQTSASPWAFSLLIFVVLTISLVEFYSMCENRGVHPLKLVGFLLGVVFLIFSFMGPYSVEPVAGYGSASLEWLKDVKSYWEEMAGFVLILGIIFPLLYFLFSARKEHAFESSMATSFGLFYIVFLGSFMLKIRFQSIFHILLFVCVSKGGDIGAYFTGSGLGKHKFHPESPNKTVEGSIGGVFLGTALAIVVSQVWLKDIFPIYLAVIYGIIITLASQLGDLAESLIKRRCGVKDSGNSIPGSGGFLDFADCLLFSAPAAYYFSEFMVK